MNIQELSRNWKAGWALDLHTISSIPLGDGRYDTTYTDVGYALNQLKYHQDYGQIDVLSNYVIAFMHSRMVTPYLKAIIPTPASMHRDIQPVYEIALKVGKALNIAVDTEYLRKKKNTNQLKEIEDQEHRENILNDAFDVLDSRYANKKVMLFDDLYRSGSTLKEITNTLYKNGRVQNVYVVTLTKTRSKR